MASKINTFLPAVIPVYKKIVSLFPSNYIQFAFAYGSGVFKQAGNTTEKKPMVDLIFVVDDTLGFHTQNLVINPDHYSFLKRFGPKFLRFMQEKWPCRVYFNTLVPFKEEGILFKYGVVQSTDFINDLLDWDHLYLAGRLHKPVKLIEPPQKRFAFALKQNLYSAIHAALIILPVLFTERELYTVLANLSYNGDFRMVFGEDKNKVNNIVDAQIPGFRKMYRPLLKSLEEYVEIPDNESADNLCMQDHSSLSRMYHLFQLPREPQEQLVNYWRLHVSWRRRDTEDALRNIANNPELCDILSTRLKYVVFKSSVQQSFKGLFTAGFKKSLEYSNKKINKMIKSKERLEC